MLETGVRSEILKETEGRGALPSLCFCVHHEGDVAVDQREGEELALQVCTDIHLVLRTAHIKINKINTQRQPVCPSVYSKRHYLRT